MPAGREIKGLLCAACLGSRKEERMEETVGSLDKDQLTRLAQYFDEKVIASTKYKRTA